MITPFPFQIDGYKFLTNTPFALLADEMGLGKSGQVVLAAEALNLSKLLVIGPAISRFNWEREFQKFNAYTERNYIVVSDGGVEIPSSNENTCIVISYDLAFGKCFEQLSKLHFDVIVVDEAHFLKSLKAKRSTKFFGNPNGLIRRTDRCWALSGTPAPNHVGELWLLLYTFGATTLSYSRFVSRYCTGYEGGYGWIITGNKVEMFPEIRAMLAPIMLRRKVEDVMKQLPPITYEDVLVEPGK